MIRQIDLNCIEHLYQNMLMIYAGCITCFGELELLRGDFIIYSKQISIHRAAEIQTPYIHFSFSFNTIQYAVKPFLLQFRGQE